MEIVWQGHSCFRIKGREATVMTDPCPPTSGYAIGKPTADIVTISHPHDNHRYLKAVAGTPVVLEDPGEYEIHGAFVTGVSTFHDTEKGAERGKNIAWIIEMEDIRVVHLGDLGHTPSADEIEDMVGADVLLIPVGGNTTIDGAKAAEVVSMLEAKIIVPMHYQTPIFKPALGTGPLETAERFLKEMEVKEIQPQPKLQITRANIPPDPQVILLEHKGQS